VPQTTANRVSVGKRFERSNIRKQGVLDPGSKSKVKEKSINDHKTGPGSGGRKESGGPATTTQDEKSEA